MYDSVLFHAARAGQASSVMRRLHLEPKSFYLATVHRAENTDDADRLAGILEAFRRLDRPVLLPLHPRTRKTLGARVDELEGSVLPIDPVPYLDMLVLEKNARIILTDSGGVQKEAYWFGVPCVTLRDETEWVELAEAGCNRIVGAAPESILAAVNAFEAAGAVLPSVRPLRRRPQRRADRHVAGRRHECSK
jgi:UDP-GlcNAc3NAcA epimerase